MQRDIRKSDVQHDVIYEYADLGIERLLSDIYRIREEETYRGDISAATIRIDLERALQSRALTPRQRQVVGLYYFATLTQEEAAATLGISQQAVDARLKTAVAMLAAYMRGEDVSSSQLTTVDFEDGATALQRWLTDAAANEPEWWTVPDAVWRELQRGDVADEPETVEGLAMEYPWLDDAQMAWKRYKEFPRPEIYPRFDGVGAKKGADGVRQRFVNYGA